jgi:hypothetical protein
MADQWHARTTRPATRQGEPMYIGLGTLIVIIIIVILLVRR